MDPQAKEAYAKEYAANKRRQLKVRPNKIAIAAIVALLLLPVMYIVISAGLKKYGSEFLQILILPVLITALALDQARKK